MSFSKFTLLAVAILLPLTAAAAPQIEAADLDFIEQASQHERDLTRLKEGESLPEAMKERVGQSDMATLQAISDAAQAPEARISVEDRAAIDLLADKADKPVEAWLEQLEGSPFIPPGGVPLAKNESLTANNKLDEKARLLVFISLGMPEQVIRSYFEQAAGRDDIVFVVRGWKPPHFTPLLQKLISLMPSEENQANVIIDPNLYREYQVKKVPMFLAQDKQGKWRRLYGEISLDGAEEEIKRGNYQRQIGPTYAVVEPDILEEIQARAEAYDWDGAVEGAKERLASYRPGHDLPAAEKDEMYYVDPTITVNQDIYTPQGEQLIAPAGTKINPLDTVTLERAYIVFDPEVRSQKDIVRQWLKERPGSMLIATRYPKGEPGSPAISDEMKSAVYTLNEQIVERFALKATPALVEQEGNLLRITVKRGPL